MLHEVPPALYRQLGAMIPPDACGAVYAESVAEGIQSGIMYTDDSMQTVLIRHCCGFAFLYGNCDGAVLHDAEEMLLHPAPFARMLLFAEHDETAAYFRKKDGYAVQQRLFFRYPAEKGIPEQNSAVRITAESLPQLRGSIVPAFSWENPAAFLEKGSGFCIMQDHTPAAWAFSAAVSSRETDIGVETDERFRRRGFAYAAASAMLRRILLQGKTPVWACRADNTASARLAAALEFIPCGQCRTIRKDH